MPIHKSVGHFQSPARNSGRNTAAIHSHTDATSTDTLTFGYTYINFVPSHGTNITCIVLHDKRPRAARKDGRLDSSRRIFPLSSIPLFLSLFLFLFRSWLSVAIFVSGQLISRRRRGTITETDLTGPGRLSEAASSNGPAIRGTFRQLREKENRVETRLVAFLMWPSVRAMNLSCVNRPLLF